MLRVACQTCGFIGPVRSLSGIRANEGRCCRITRESLERASLRILSRRYHKARDTVMRIIHRVSAQLPDSVAIAKKFCPLWSGILVFDGKVVRVFDKVARRLDLKQWSEDELRWMHKMRWLCGVDFGTGDLPHYDLGDSENKIDLVLYFKTLQMINYRLVALVCDGNPLIPEAAKFVYGKELIVQRCTRHFIEDLKRLLPREEGTERERATLEQLIARIQRVIEADTLDSAGEHWKSLQAYSSTCLSPIKYTMLAMFKRTKLELTAHLLHPELHLPHTTNDVESLFKQLMLRLRSLGRFGHHRYARNYLNAWALLRRFTPFTDCRANRRYRNKKTPLELAGCEIKHIDPLKLTR